jgi:hypothetical protein
MDKDAIDLALHEIQQMVEVSIRATESLQGVNHDPAPWTVSRVQTMSCWISASLTSRGALRQRGRCCSRVTGPVAAKPVLSIVRD